MDTTKLTDALRELLPDALTWKFGLYSTTKGRDGAELEWNLCDMSFSHWRIRSARGGVRR